MIKVLLVFVVVAIFSNASHASNLKPFGLSGTQINVEEFKSKFPSLSKFLNEYVRNSRPLVVRQVLNNQNDFKIWENDDRLKREVPGLEKTRVRIDFISNGKRQEKNMEFGEYLEHYQSERLILADYVPTNLRKYILLQEPLQCEALLETVQSAFIVMSDLNSSPLLISDVYDQLYCLYRGQKNFVLADTQKNPSLLQLIATGDESSYVSHFNPDQVDLEKFPSLIDSEFHLVNLTSGDCLLIPNEWIFQERTFHSSISIISNVEHQQVLLVDDDQIKECEKKTTFDENFSLDQIEWTNERDPPNLRDLMIKLIKTKVQGLDKWQKVFSKHLAFDLNSDAEISSIFEEFYGIVDFDGNGEISVEEINQIHGVHQHHISDILYELSKKIHEHRQEKQSKTKKNGETKEHNEF